MSQQRRTIVSAWIGITVLVAPLTVACSNAEDIPVKPSEVVAVADVRAGSISTTKTVRVTVTKPVTKTVSKTKTVLQTRTVTATPKTVRVTAPPTTVTVQAPAATTTVVRTETVAAAAQGLVDNSSVYFANCDAARAAGAAPVRSGDPGYRAGLDRDGDGIGCE